MISSVKAFTFIRVVLNCPFKLISISTTNTPLLSFLPLIALVMFVILCCSSHIFAVRIYIYEHLIIQVNICDKLVQIIDWLYYCHKFTYFVHMKCATSPHTASTIGEIEEEGDDIEPDLVEFPLHREESLFDLIITQCCRLQAEYQGKDENNISAVSTASDPPIIREHWSHEEHPLVQLLFTDSENDNYDNNCNRRMLICDGCIQLITVSHPSYYACIQCGFFLHSFCATKLPNELVAGVSPFHPQHSLFLRQPYRFYSLVWCKVCGCYTNGFYYRCKTCDITIDIRCVFLPVKIKHESHKHHLIQRPSSKSLCSVSNFRIEDNNVEYACETCSNFQIRIHCAFYPRMMKHRYDDHPITLRQPPFFYEGVFYCEICEEQVDNELWLYHCGGKYDHSFHYDCLRWFESVKLGGTIKLDIKNQSHTLTLVLKNQSHTLRKNTPLYYCELRERL